jgi:hypothetical protein
MERMSLTRRGSGALVVALGIGPLTFLFGLFGLCAPAARATVSQPNGDEIPVPSAAGEISVVTSRGFQRDAVTLEGLFKYRQEMLDPVRDANTAPGTFSPQCRFTGQLVLRGGSCRPVFGWYNVTPGSTTPPPDAEIYELVPAQLPMCPMPPMPINPAMACCDDGDFCPLADPTTTQAPQHRFNSPTFSADNIITDKRYKGGLIGFAIIKENTVCPQTKYSQLELNTKSLPDPPTNGRPWVTALIYQSTVTPGAYYIAFEDRPMEAKTWKNTTGIPNDGDFNDFVYLVTGLNCEGGGKACDTKMPGICAAGTTQCSNGTTITCKPDLTPTEEICDGLDNDCDGMVDQGSPCKSVNQICDRGTCVQKCNDSEFPCALGLQCEQGYCKDPRCIGKTCAAEQICVAGECRGGCDGVVCPPGQSCRLGRCIDPCMGVTCPGGVCENGACVPKCSCRQCAAGKACAPDGRCVDTGCEMMDCAPKACVKGLCMDPCYGATRCPAGQMCTDGSCVDLPPPPPGTGGSTGSTRFDGGASGGRFGSTGTGATSGNPDGGLPDGGPSLTGDNGVRLCACNLTGAPAGVLTVVSLFIALAAASRRRRQDD